MRNIVIFGDTKFSERLYEYISLEQIDKVIAFTQESKYINRKDIKRIPVIPFEDLSQLLPNTEFEIILGIGYSGMNTLRENIYNICKLKKYKIGTYISSKAIVYTSLIGDGNFICPGTILGPNVSIGNGNFFESGVVLSHDNVICDFNYFSTNVVIGGSTNIGNNNFFGLNSTIKNSLNIQDKNIIGSASNLLYSIRESNGVYVGNPCKKINKYSYECKI